VADRFELNPVEIINLSKMSEPTTSEASANHTVTQSETDGQRADAVTEKDLRETILALQSEINILKDRQKKLEKQQENAFAERGIAGRPDTPPSAREMPLKLHPCRWWIQDFITAIPIFDGRNLWPSQFITICRRVQRMITAQEEAWVVRTLISKLSGDAYVAWIDDKRINTIAELIKVLKLLFGGRCTLAECYDDVKCLEQKQGEDILHFVARTTYLHHDIIEAIIYEGGSLTNNVISDITNKIATAFCLGLPYEIQVALINSNHLLLDDIFKDAIEMTRNCEKKMRHNNERGNRHSQCLRETNNMTRETDDSQNPKINTDRETFNANKKFCRYCKKTGHQIENCKKRENNARKSGNLRKLSTSSPGLSK